MKAKVIGNYVDLIDNVYFPQLIKETSENCYFEGKPDDAFYICDIGDIYNKHKLWTLKLPRVEPFYAVKCNPHPMIIHLLSKLNAGFDCASKSEMVQVLNANVAPDRIIYANPCKQSSHIKFAEVNGVQMITFDSVSELKKLHQLYPKAQLVLRIFVGFSHARCPLGLKFGAQFSDISPLLEVAKNLNANVIGVSFHVGSGCFDASAYDVAIKLSYQVFKIATKVGFNFTLLDIGGGFPGNLDTQENVKLFHDVCDTINNCIEEFFPVNSGVRIIAEPGRFYVSSAFQLSCTVTTVRKTTVELNGYLQDKFSYYLNDGVYGSFNCVVFDHYIGEHYLLTDPSDGIDDTTHESTFWGPTCDSADKILENFYIRELTVGERIVFKGMGAYTMAAASRFNGFEPPFTRFVISHADWAPIASLVQDEIPVYSEEESELLDISYCFPTLPVPVPATGS